MKYTPRSLKVCESASQKAHGLLYINPSFISYKFRKIKFFGFLFEISFVVVFYKKTHPVRIECIVVTNFSCRPVECLHHLIFSISINDARYLTFDLKKNCATYYAYRICVQLKGAFIKDVRRKSGFLDPFPVYLGETVEFFPHFVDPHSPGSTRRR